MKDFKSENISVSDYCLHHTAVGDQVDIYDSGYYMASCCIDSEDLFARHMSHELGRRYVDSVSTYKRTIIDEDGNKKYIHECTYHKVYIGISKADFDKFRIAMITDKGTMFTRWYNKSEPKAFDSMYQESDNMLKDCKNWHRCVEYSRTWPKDSQ